MDSFEFWLRRMESKLERNSCRPTTREDADDLWEKTKVGGIFIASHSVFSREPNIEKILQQI